MKIASEQMFDKVNGLYRKLIFLVENDLTEYPFPGPCPEFPNKSLKLRFMTCLMISKDFNDFSKEGKSTNRINLLLLTLFFSFFNFLTEIADFTRDYLRPIYSGLADYIEININKQLIGYQRYHLGYFLGHISFLLVGALTLIRVANSHNRTVIP